MKSLTAKRMIPESIVNSERRSRQLETRSLISQSSRNFQESMANLRKAHNLGSHLLLSLMFNVVFAIACATIIMMDKEATFAGKVTIGIGFALIAGAALFRLIRLLRHLE